MSYCNLFSQSLSMMIGSFSSLEFSNGARTMLRGRLAVKLDLKAPLLSTCASRLYEIEPKVTQTDSGSEDCIGSSKE